jgi:hypothetical protein
MHRVTACVLFVARQQEFVSAQGRRCNDLRDSPEEKRTLIRTLKMEKHGEHGKIRA